MNYNYENGRFTEAIYSMAKGLEPLQERIGNAYNYYLHLLESKNLPEDIRVKFDDLKKRLTSIEAADGEGNFMATARELTNDEALKVASEIIDMAETVASHMREIKMSK